MPSRRHQLLATVLPRLRRARELESAEAERARIERWHQDLPPAAERSLPTVAVPALSRRYAVVREELLGDAGVAFPVFTLTRRGRAPRRTVVYLHGGGFVAGFDPFHVRYAARLARALDARVVLPDYPLAPEHTWRDSHDALVDLVARHAADAQEAGEAPLALGGDSAGGGLAVAVALGVRRRGGPQPGRLLLHAPWVDLTTSTPETATVSAGDPWLFLGKLKAYADWWAGSADDLGRPEVSPALAPLEDLAGLPPAVMFYGTRDTLAPGCRLLARRAAEAGWPLTAVEEPGLLHVYALFPGVPEAGRAWRRTLEFLRSGATGATTPGEVASR